MNFTGTGEKFKPEILEPLFRGSTCLLCGGWQFQPTSYHERHDVRRQYRLFHIEYYCQICGAEYGMDFNEVQLTNIENKHAKKTICETTAE